MGTYFTTALLATGKHTVTAITRADSTSALPPGVTKIAVDYDSHESLAAALKGHDALVITLAVFAPEGTHGKLVRAAAAAEIPFVVPNVYGPDPMNEAVTRDLPFWQQGQALIREIQELGMQSVVLSCGFWHEFSLGGTSMRYGFDFKKNEVVFVDRGVSKITGSTFPQVSWAASFRTGASQIADKVTPTKVRARPGGAAEPARPPAQRRRPTADAVALRQRLRLHRQFPRQPAGHVREREARDRNGRRRLGRLARDGRRPHGGRPGAHGPRRPARLRHGQYATS